MATIDALQKELVGLVAEVPAFALSGFYIFDIDDLEDKARLQSFPAAGVTYDGASVVDDTKGNAAVPVSQGASGVSLITLHFTVIIVIQYAFAGQDDTKVQATNLLDDVRSRVLGYRGVNTRPWRFVGERPEPAASGEGLAFYSQTWQTTVPCVGNFNNT